jgi:hypothetical protein
MANTSHLKILAQGVDVWNRWRIEKPKISPNLSGGDLSQRSLTGANFRGTQLSDAKLDSSELLNADFYGAILQNASLTFSTLNGSDFSHALLHRAKLNNSFAADRGFQGLEESRFVPEGFRAVDAGFEGGGGAVGAGEKSLAWVAVWVYKAGLFVAGLSWDCTPLLRRRLGTPTLPHEM